MYDFLIVGAGLFGCVVANKLTERGYSCLVVDKRNHVGGNCYTKKILDIDVHMYGAHIFHTKNKEIWEYISTFSSFNNYKHSVKVTYKNKIYSLPINLNTLYQVFGVTTPQEAQKIIDISTVNNNNNLEDYCRNLIGDKLYKLFIKGYTEKQWMTSAKKLPCEIIKRIPIRTSFNDNYFDDDYQGIPIDGYTCLFEKMLLGSDVKLNTSFNKDMLNDANKIIFTGKIDEFFNYSIGELQYRGLNFEHNNFNVKDYQGCPVMNYTERKIPYTRIIEHKHFTGKETNNTIITHEYPIKYSRGDIPYYPINNNYNNELYLSYLKESSHKYKHKVYFGGRLGQYKYLDMDETIKEAFILVDKL